MIKGVMNKGETKMKKLIDAFNAAKNHKTASMLVRYLDAHMMAMCFATEADMAAIAEAKKFAA